MQTVLQGTTVSTAASAINVPQKTTWRLCKWKVKRGSKPGRETVLTVEEDAALMSYLVYMAERGYPLAWTKCSGNANRFILKQGQASTGGIIFVNDTGTLNSVCVEVRSDKLNCSQAECLHPEVVGEYLETLWKLRNAEPDKSDRKMFFLPSDMICSLSTPVK